MMMSTSPVLGGILLIAAGLFQWTPLKYACLSRCRSPLGFLMTEWRDGTRGALHMGLKHGAYCIGCCWMLMALLFVAGVMNILVVAAIGLCVGGKGGRVENAWGEWLVSACRGWPAIAQSGGVKE